MADGAQLRSLAVAGQIRPGQRTVLAVVGLATVRPNPRQPRHHFDPDALAELAASIKARGLLQPIVVKREADGYLLMAGERRWRAKSGRDSGPSWRSLDWPRCAQIHASRDDTSIRTR